VIATTTPEMSKEKVETSSLLKILQKVPVNEPNNDEAVRILEAKALQFEGQHRVYFSYQALQAAVKLAGQYLHDEYLPEKAIKLLEEATLVVKTKKGERAIVGSNDVAEVIAELTNIPVTKITMEEGKKLLNLEKMMQEKVVGQSEAINMIGSALRRARTEMRGTNRPIASFLFMGPTGVGKTQVTKTLAEVYYGSETNMVRLDMSEYQSDDALAKMIGDARTGKGGYLTEKIRRYPFSLILLDEVEKANPRILDLFLQVLDDGRLTDASGKTVDFTNTIIIGTSNAGTGFIQESIREGKNMAVIREVLIDNYLKEYFRPELINRFDGIVVFSPLEMKDVVEIARMFLRQLAERLEEKGIEFGFEEEAVEELAKLGFDPTMGARPLRRVVQDKIEDALAKLFLENKLKRRDKVILRKGIKLEVEKAEEL
ncbi:MAG TPA: AAA family ATPase, partial [Patescibacteria group bacterium]|nr:AAA family ATPase [Patescibacteria group bacterium]